MNFYFDTEFLEGPQRKWNGLMSKPTIDLISIGIVSGYESMDYYAVSKEFNLKEAWYRYQEEATNEVDSPTKKTYWIRENVLRPIFYEFIKKERGGNYKAETLGIATTRVNDDFTYRNFKKLLNKYGKSRYQMSKEIPEYIDRTIEAFMAGKGKKFTALEKKFINFYAYYADYDWVVFCWLFGNMISLPKDFPMYCRDLKQIMDDKGISKASVKANVTQENEHNALDDAKWNRKLHYWLNSQN